MGDPHWAMPAIVIMAVWKNFGYNMIILLAALQSIPEDLYEAARIDGASSWQQFRHVTLPSLTPVLLLVSILTMTGYFQLFAEPYVMTEGGPLESTKSVLFYMYDEGFKWWSLGRASAVAFLLFVIIFFVTLAVAIRDVERPRHEALDCADQPQRSSSARFSLFFRCCGWCPFRSCPEARRAPIRRRLLPSDPTLGNYHELFTRHAAARYMLNSAFSRNLRDRHCARLQHHGRLCVREAALRGTRTNLPGATRSALVIPAQVTMIPLFAMVKAWDS